MDIYFGWLKRDFVFRPTLLPPHAMPDSECIQNFSIEHKMKLQNLIIKLFG